MKISLIVCLTINSESNLKHRIQTIPFYFFIQSQRFENVLIYKPHFADVLNRITRISRLFRNTNEKETRVRYKFFKPMFLLTNWFRYGRSG